MCLVVYQRGYLLISPQKYHLVFLAVYQHGYLQISPQKCHLVFLVMFQHGFQHLSHHRSQQSRLPISPLKYHRMCLVVYQRGYLLISPQKYHLVFLAVYQHGYLQISPQKCHLVFLVMFQHGFQHLSQRVSLPLPLRTYLVLCQLGNQVDNHQVVRHCNRLDNLQWSPLVNQLVNPRVDLLQCQHMNHLQIRLYAQQENQQDSHLYYRRGGPHHNLRWNLLRNQVLFHQ